MVRVDDRKESSAQFIDTARELEIFTIKKCIKFPKRYSRYISDTLVELSQEIYNDVTRANNIFIDSVEACDQRIKYLNRAENNLKCFGAQLTVAKELFDHISKVDLSDDEKKPVCSTNAWVIWGKLIIDESRLIGSVLKSDKARKKKFLEQNK